MAWNEDWLDEERPDPSDLPEYSIWPDTRYGWSLFVYFTGVPLLFYAALATVGTEAILIGSIPVLVWLTLLIAGVYIVGLLHIHLRERDKTEEERQPVPETEEQKGEEVV